jgi:hypothetical protein
VVLNPNWQTNLGEMEYHGSGKGIGNVADNSGEPSSVAGGSSNTNVEVCLCDKTPNLFFPCLIYLNCSALTMDHTVF